jgi:hypothetical protein
MQTKVLKYTIMVFVFQILVCLPLCCQVNLVPNPSFELSVACPTASGLLSVANWSSFRGSPDYFNSCSSVAACGTPSNQFGFQVPATGVAYCGFLNIWPILINREYLAAKLTQTLSIGTRYYLSMKVSLAERWLTTPTPMFIPSNKCGMKFTTNQYSVQDPLIPTNQATMYSAAIISDTTGWTTLRGTFVSDSAYQYVVIGNFFYNAQTDTISRPLGFDSYFFVDDVVVSTDSTVLFSGVSEIKNIKHISLIYSENRIKVEVLESATNEVCIIDLNGNLMYRRKFQHNLEVSTSDLVSGIYVILVYEHGILSETKKIVVIN